MRKSARTQIPPFFDNDPYIHMLAGAGCYYKTRTFPLEETTVLPAKSDSDFMLCLQSHHVLIIDRSLVY